MAPKLTDQDIAARMRDRLGPWTEPEPGLLRWWVGGPGPGEGVALWVPWDARSGRPAPGTPEPCEVWISRPCVALPERCLVEDLEQLDELIARVHAWARSDPPASPARLCPPARAAPRAAAGRGGNPQDRPR